MLFRYLMIVLSVLLCIAGLFSFNFNKLKSDAYSTIPAGTIENIFDSNTGAFNITNLNSMALKAGYADFLTMVKTVENVSATDAKAGIKKSQQFNNMTVKLGSFTRKDNGQTEDLIWLPTFLSQNDDGDAILTLWLATSESTNTKSNQEVTRYSDGTFNIVAQGEIGRASCRERV